MLTMILPRLFPLMVANGFPKNAIHTFAKTFPLNRGFHGTWWHNRLVGCSSYLLGLTNTLQPLVTLRQLSRFPRPNALSTGFSIPFGQIQIKPIQPSHGGFGDD